MTDSKKLFRFSGARLDFCKRIALLIGTSLAVTVLLSSIVAELMNNYEYGVGEVARHTVKAPRDFFVEDVPSTNKRRAEALAGVRKVFIFDDTESRQLERQIAAMFTALSNVLSQNSSASPKTADEAKKVKVERQLKINLEGAEWDILLDSINWPTLERELRMLLEPILTHGVIADKEEISGRDSHIGAVLVQKSTGAQREFDFHSPVYSLHEAKELFEAAFETNKPRWSPDFASVVQKLGGYLLRPNILLDRTATERKVEAVQKRVAPVYFQVRRGEVIIRAGDTVGPVEQRKLARLQEIHGRTDLLETTAGYFLLSLLILVSAYLFCAAFWPGFAPSIRDLNLLSLTLIGSFMLLRVGAIVGTGLNLSYPDISAHTFLLATPFAAGGILLQVVLGAGSVMMFMVSFALLSGVFLEESWLVLLLIFVGSIVGAVTARKCNKRATFLAAGLRVALVNALLVMCWLLLYPPVHRTEEAIIVLCAVIGGVLSGVFAASFAPLAEYIGGYATNIKLLELASLDHPLLRELSLQAPGTWNHSIVLGQLCEVAAEAVGANPHLARVGAYFHDIGKAGKPGYFIENQTTRENRHDKLTPSMSALIIKAHVKEGIELARQYRVPQAVIDFIPQHHGTALIEYFYEKALKEAAPGETVDEMHYRYAGPKPQTKEAGIIMLGDAVEAASKTLPDPTISKIQGMVQKIINKVFSSGQLDESELTLKDLHLIAKSFTHVLSGIFHHRVDYAEPAEKIKEAKEAPAENEAELDEGRQGDAGRSPVEAQDGKRDKAASAEKGAVGDNKETLRRLGLLQ